MVTIDRTLSFSTIISTEFRRSGEDFIPLGRLAISQFRHISTEGANKYMRERAHGKTRRTGKLILLSASPSVELDPDGQRRSLTKEDGDMDVEAAIKEQGDLVRRLKSQKADKSLIKAEVDKLLALKAQITAPTTTTNDRGGGPEDGAGQDGKKFLLKCAKGIKMRYPRYCALFCLLALSLLQFLSALSFFVSA